MLRPRALEPGDRIAIVSPASPFTREEFEGGIAEIERRGFKPVWDDRIFGREPMVSGPAHLRAQSFLDALRDPSVRAIVTVRGGYGSVEILPFIDPSELKAARKIICGYSDITSLLIFSVCYAGVNAFHGPTLAQRLSQGEAGYDWSSFEKAMCHPRPMGELKPEGLSVLKPGMGEGMLIGGTLTTIAAGLGTPYGIELDRPSILFIEDIRERPYKLRRMLTQLKLAGVFDNVTGIILGSMTDCDEPESTPSGPIALNARDVITSFFADFDGPILAGFPSGHGPAPTWTLPFGVQSLISTRDGGSLLIEEPAVE